MNLRHVDFNLLKAFDVLMDERNVTRAADRLAVSQPAVSGMLTRLRDCFDDPLFIRAQHGIIPTPRAESLAAPVKRVLADIRDIMTPEAFVPAEAKLTLKVAATDYAMRNVLTPLIKKLQALAPGIRVSVTQIEDTLVGRQLERGEIDLALMSESNAPEGCLVQSLFEEHYAFAMRTDHSSSVDLPLSLDQFCQLNHALVSYYGGAFMGDTDRALAKLGRSRHVAVSVPSFMVLNDLLLSTDLIAVAPSRTFDDMQGLTVSMPPLDIPGFTKVAVWHERTNHDPAQIWLRALLTHDCFG